MAMRDPSTTLPRRRYRFVASSLFWRVLFALIVSGLLVMALFATSAVSH